MKQSQKTPLSIKDKLRKKVTLSKRKRCLMKKAIELSVMCDVDIFMVVLDSEKQNIFELNSAPDFDVRVISYMLNKVNKHQFKSRKFTNMDYEAFLGHNQDSEGDESNGVS